MNDASKTTKWRRYRPGDVVEFDQIAAGVSPRGQGRLVKTQHLLPGERYIVLPPLSVVEIEEGAETHG